MPRSGNTMQPIMPATKIDSSPPVIDYATSLDKLLQLYTEIDKVAVALPFVTIPMISNRASRDYSKPQGFWQTLEGFVGPVYG